MLASLKRHSLKTSIFLFISFFGFTALWYSPFIVSLSTAVCAVLVIINWKQILQLPYRNLSIVLGIIVLLAFIDLVFAPQNKLASAKILLVIGLFTTCIAGFQNFKISVVQLVWYLLLISVTVFIINVLSVGNYLLNKSHFDEMLLQSKSIPILNMHHIHFGIINAVVIFGLVGLLVFQKVEGKLKGLAYLLLIVNVICFHILSSRTGLLSFYIAASFSFLTYAIGQRKYLVLVVGPVLMAAMLLLTYSLSTSFQSKIKNTIEDVNSWGHGAEINHKSMAMRIEAYKASYSVIKENPFGTGADAQESAIMSAFEQQNSVLEIENRKGPHNQFLEFGVKYGWLGVVLIIVFFISLLSLVRDTTFLYVALIIVLFISMLFESLLERQASIYFVALFIPLYYYLFSKKTINGSILT
ncbi:MAG: hypothetical protein COA58_03530 [Bacteroidetes bacterium]|nr:MAG: hypothetical protein COA58_03530 [Bacteroidota bacterium]